MNTDTATADKEILGHFTRHETLRRLRPLFDSALGYPVWWILPRPNGNTLKHSKHALDASYEIWHDPRLKEFRSVSRVSKALARKIKETQAFYLDSSKGVSHYCIPLLNQSRLIGFFVLSGVRKPVKVEAAELLNHSVRLLLESSYKTEEINRLSATLRPRAIALSTVHTVHRIINSTLNLDELVRRLAHLTAQVLRVQKCSIYLADKKEFTGQSQKKKSEYLTCMAKVGYPKTDKAGQRIIFGKGLEGRVAKTAQIVLRKKFICLPLIDEDVVGVVLVHGKKDKKPFNHLDLEILNTLAEESAIAIKNARLYEEQRKVTLGTIQSLAVILGAKTSSGNQLSQEAFLSLALGVAQELKLSDDATQALHYATLLKDTAKIGIPEEILKKREKLTGDEVRLIREHPIKGAKIVQNFENLKSVAPIILYSREKYDGSGYPEGLKGEQIPLGARILSTINAFEAIVMGRPYRNQASIDEALDEIKRNSGTQFDPRVVDSFLRVVDKESIRKTLRASL